jgi:hypothetical protein
MQVVRFKCPDQVSCQTRHIYERQVETLSSALDRDFDTLVCCTNHPLNHLIVIRTVKSAPHGLRWNGAAIVLTSRDVFM